MHSAKARPKAHPEYMKRKCAHLGAPPLSCRSGLNIGRILAERLVSVDAKSVCHSALVTDATKRVLTIAATVAVARLIVSLSYWLIPFISVSRFEIVFSESLGTVPQILRKTDPLLGMALRHAPPSTGHGQVYTRHPAARFHPSPMPMNSLPQAVCHDMPESS